MFLLNIRFLCNICRMTRYIIILKSFQMHIKPHTLFFFNIPNPASFQNQISYRWHHRNIGSSLIVVSVMSYILSTTIQIMQSPTQGCKAIGFSVSIVLHYSITSHKKRIKFVENIFTLSSKLVNYKGKSRLNLERGTPYIK